MMHTQNVVDQLADIIEQRIYPGFSVDVGRDHICNFVILQGSFLYPIDELAVRINVCSLEDIGWDVNEPDLKDITFREEEVEELADEICGGLPKIPVFNDPRFFEVIYKGLEHLGCPLREI